jgi:hypothetical protein
MCNSKFMELTGTLLLRKERREKKGDKTGTPDESRMNQEIHDGTEPFS